MAGKIRDSSIPKPPKVPGTLNSGQSLAEWWTPERKLEASERAKRMIADGTTLFGSPESGRMGAAKRWETKRRMLDRVADVAAERADEMANVLTNMLRSGNHRKQIDAIDRFTRIAESAAKNEREHEKELRAMTPEQLRALVLERLSEFVTVDEVDGGEMELPEPAPESAQVVEPDIVRQMIEDRLAQESE